ncbi:hypothetical protein ES319_A06G162300v1 [Gossypium barbadense]|uniref:ABC transporter domain-containing protein n=1 Tax=Gossypium barbadense TaxID=3634 RepID=A0A5J5VG75_GOSBA|nr:hypothetical protein ES319_A06G162300v1 [Gossypium barbadense]
MVLSTKLHRFDLRSTFFTSPCPSFTPNSSSLVSRKTFKFKPTKITAQVFTLSVETSVKDPESDIESLISSNTEEINRKRSSKQSITGASGISSSVKLENISKSYKGVTVSKDVSWEVKEGEKVGLVGVNAAGKTTGLRIITGQEEPDSGNVIKAKSNMKNAFLNQEFEVSMSRTVREELMSAFKEEMEISDRLERVQKTIEGATEDLELMGRLLDEFDLLQRRAQAVDLDEVDAKVSKLMPELGFSPEDSDSSGFHFLSTTRRKQNLFAPTISNKLIHPPPLHAPPLLPSISRINGKMKACCRAISTTYPMSITSRFNPCFITKVAEPNAGLIGDEDDVLQDPNTLSHLKTELLQQLKGINRGIFGVPSSKKSDVEAMVKLLESRNPTPDPILNLEKVGGCWKLLYSTITILGSKRTKLGLRDFITLGEFFQIIDIEKSKAVNVIKFNARGLKLLNGKLTIEASFKIASKSRVDVSYDNSTITPDQLLNVFSKNYDVLLAIFNPEGWLEITYVDDTMRIGRDDKENIFILERSEEDTV